MNMVSENKQSSSDSPVISIIIPTFNSMTGNRRIDRLLKSIFNQTYHNFEVIVVDSLSTDGTVEACKEFQVSLIQTKCTISEADNIGLEKATGDFVLFLDSDMELLPNFLEECVEVIKSTSADCINMDFVVVESEGSPLLNYVKLRNLELNVGAAPLNIYLYSRKIIGNVRFPQSENHIVGEEYIFRHHILKKNPRIATVKTKTLHYHDPNFTWVVRRSWKYGKWFEETKRHLSTSENLSFIKYNSVMNEGFLHRFRKATKNKVHLIPSFMLYIYVKYVSFAFGYISTIL